jgi:hypothetical protein
MKFLELVLVIAACLSPMFFLAGKVDGDEFAKSLIGIVQAGGILGVLKGYQLWIKNHQGTKGAD